ncbi:MAG: EFR1 family ferrodoxin [Firmicutes bacterium]|nr:EFR1 family ferrodoxin [Bacillota bacterium]
MNNRIFCYSGTGNSFASAKQIGKHFNITPEFITEELIESGSAAACEFCVILCPSYAYGVPVLVKKFLKKFPLKADYLAILITCGTKTRGTAAEAVKLLKKNSQQVDFAADIQSVENYVHLFGHPKPEIQVERIAAQKIITDDICRRLEAREKVSVKLHRPFSAFVSGLFRSVKYTFVWRYRIKNTCNGCEICRKVCPTGAIRMKERKRKGNVVSVPKFKARKCDHCQACMQLCPKRAIKYFRIKPQSPRYLHHDVTLNELIKRD